MKFLIPKKTDAEKLNKVISNLIDFECEVIELEDYKIILVKDELTNEVDVRLYINQSATKNEVFNVCRDIILYYFIW